MNKNRQDKKITVTGIILTMIVSLGFIWAAREWLNRYNRPPKLDVKDIKRNEVRACENLKHIAQAQDKYKQVDWDKDGVKTYAKFPVHLWTSVDKKSEPIAVGLIDKQLGFAMGRPRAVDGYFFQGIYNREVSSEKENIKKLDYEKEWVIAAIPKASSKTGFLIFLADGCDRIFVKNTPGYPSSCPLNLLEQGWIKIGTVEDLKNFQNNISYLQQK